MQQDCSVVLWEHPEWELITHYFYFLHVGWSSGGFPESLKKMQ